MKVAEYLWQKEQELKNDTYYQEREFLLQSKQEAFNKLMYIQNQQVIYPSTNFGKQIAELKKAYNEVCNRLDAFLDSEITEKGQEQAQPQPTQPAGNEWDDTKPDTFTVEISTENLAKLKLNKPQALRKYMHRANYDIVATSETESPFVYVLKVANPDNESMELPEEFERKNV